MTHPTGMQAYDVLVTLWGNTGTTTERRTVYFFFWGGVFKEGENFPCQRSAGQPRPGCTYFQFVYSWRPNCQFPSICCLASNFNSRSLAPLHFFRAPKSIETVESVQNAFNEISFTGAYFMQRHCRMDKKKNLQCCKHSFKPTIHVHLLQAKVFHTDTSDTQSKG